MARNLNFKKASEEKPEFKPLPSDAYNVVVDEAKADKSKKKEDMVTITWKVVDGDYKGRLLWDRILWNDSLIWKLQNVLIAGGLEELAEDEDLSMAGYIKALNDGLKVTVYVEQSTYDGNPSNNIKTYRPFEGENEESSNGGELF